MRERGPMDRLGTVLDMLNAARKLAEDDKVDFLAYLILMAEIEAQEIKEGRRPRVIATSGKQPR